jgi:hypothetical protein
MRSFNNDGQSENSNVIAVILSTSSIGDVASGNMQLYPNPTTGVVNLCFADKQQRTIQVLDLLGRAVQTATLTTSETALDITDLPQGNYIIKITTNGQVLTNKLIKE